MVLTRGMKIADHKKRRKGDKPTFYIKNIKVKK